MEIDTFDTINNVYFSQMIIIEIMARITGLFAVAGFITYLVGVSWLCFTEEMVEQSRVRGQSTI